MSPKRLQNKIERLLAELYQNCPIRYRRSSYWQTWLNSNSMKAFDILTKNKAQCIGEGASRIVFSIKHAGATYVFKVVYTVSSNNVVSGEAEDDNHAEIKAVKRMKKSIWTRSLVLPMITYFKSEYVGWVSVWPYAIEQDYFQPSKEVDPEYSLVRYDLIKFMTTDVHGGNLGFWKGHLWLIDFNFDDCKGGEDIVKKKHKKKATKHRKAYREISKLVRSFD